MPSSVFTSNSATIGFAVVIILFFVGEQVGGVIIPWLKRGGARVQRRNAGSNILVFVCWIAILAVSASFGKNDIALLPVWAYYVGLGVMLAGIVFRQWAIAVLGRYFSGVIGVQIGQKVVESGPYRWIRHPSYTGALFFFAGMALAFQSWAAVLISVAIFGVVYGHRMFVEEKVLIKEFGDSYVAYMKRTKRIIPKIV
jgi:protein-S-isoprenylcysteine O-methyltransferase Ste14